MWTYSIFLLLNGQEMLYAVSAWELQMNACVGDWLTVEIILQYFIKGNSNLVYLVTNFSKPWGFNVFGMCIPLSLFGISSKVINDVGEDK